MRSQVAIKPRKWENIFDNKGSITLAGGVLGLLLLVLGGLWWVSRGDWIYPVQPDASLLLEPPVTGGDIPGQTFVAAQAGLQGISLKVHRPTDPANQQIRLRLYAKPGAQTILREAVASTAGLGDGEFLTFRFEPIAGSRNTYYYFTVQVEPTTHDNQPVLYAGPLNSYVNGSAYADDFPQDAQLTFLLNYHRRFMALDFLQLIITGLPAAFVILALLLLPGATLLIWLLPRIELDAIEWLAMMTGLSLSIYPLMIALLRYTPVVLSGQLVRVIFVGLGFLSLVGIYLQRKKVLALKLSSVSSWVEHPAIIALSVVFALSWLVRIAVIQGLDAPLWADSYHHALLSQLIVDHGRLAESWEPYAPLQSITYHVGFHSMVAVFHWLTGQAIVTSILVFGQLLNFIAVLMAYVLGRRLGGSAWVGLFAALVTGLISSYPMFYVNWGRYTQLAGQVILPVLVISTWLLLENKRRDWALLSINILLAAGLTLTHYRVVLFYPCFVIPLLLIRWFQAGWKRRVLVEDTVRMFGVALGTLLLVSPRLLELIGSRLWNINLAIARQGMNIEYTREVHNALLNLFDFLPPVVVILAWVGLVLGSWRRRPALVAVGLWWLMLLLIANPHFLGLPGAGLITNFAVYIGAYLIFSVLAGFILGELVQKLEESRPVVGWLLLPVIVGLALWGARQQLTVLETSGMLVTRPDLRAMAWLKEHLPQEAQILVNSRLTYGGWGVAGTDGGWWLPLLTGRQITAPPLIYGLEKSPYADYVFDVRETYLDLRQPGLSDHEFARRMLSHDLEYIYIGQQRGSVWPGDETPLDPTWLIDSAAFNLIYAQDGVRIFQINPAFLAQ